MTILLQSEKKAVLKSCRKLLDLGLVSELSGNVSVRSEVDGRKKLIVITPTGHRYSELSEDDIAVVDFNLEPVEGNLIPSSESLMHIEIYRNRADVGAVIHTHSIFSSVLAVSGIKEIPAIIDEAVIAIGGSIHVSEYAFPSSHALASNVCAALGQRKAAIIKNHGAVCVGQDLAEALDICTLTERLAQVYYYASRLGEVHALPDTVIEAETSIYTMRRKIMGK